MCHVHAPFDGSKPGSARGAPSHGIYCNQEGLRIRRPSHHAWWKPFLVGRYVRDVAPARRRRSSRLQGRWWRCRRHHKSDVVWVVRARAGLVTCTTGRPSAGGVLILCVYPALPVLPSYIAPAWLIIRFCLLLHPHDALRVHAPLRDSAEVAATTAALGSAASTQPARCDLFRRLRRPVCVTPRCCHLIDQTRNRSLHSVPHAGHAGVIAVLRPAGREVYLLCHRERQEGARGQRDPRQREPQSLPRLPRRSRPARAPG